MCTDVHRFIQGPYASTDLSIGRGVLEPIPSGYQEATKFWGIQKLYTDFQLHGGKGQCL